MSKETYFTLPQVAKRLGHHRTTLLRMEQRGILPPAKWATKPIRARVYTEDDIKVIGEKLKAYFEHRPGGAGGLVLDADDVETPEDA